MASKKLVILISLYLVYITASGQAGSDCVDDQGGMHADGAEFYRTAEPCVIYKCTDGTYNKTGTECVDPDETVKKCHAVGTEITGNCITRECGDGDEGIMFYVVSVKCTDVDNNCHEPGTIFRKKIGNELHAACTCQVNGEQADYRCD